MTQISFLDQLDSSRTHTAFSHNGVCSDVERLKLENRYSKLFVEDGRFSRQVVSFQANRQSILHSWIKYREGFSARLVDTLLTEFGVMPGDNILEPFAGSATTLLVAKARGINADGIEILPNCHLAWEAKSRFDRYRVDELKEIETLIEEAKPINTGEPFPHLKITESAFSAEIERDLMFYTSMIQNLAVSTDATILMRLVLTSILEEISFTRKDGQYLRWDYRARKVRARQEIREEQAKKATKSIDKGELPSVRLAILKALHEVIADIKVLQQIPFQRDSEQSLINGSTLEVLPTLPDNRYAAVVTSPPYANRYDYTRTYALELAYLGVGAGIFDLRQQLLSCTVESHSKIDSLGAYYQGIGALDRYTRIRSIVESNPAYLEANHALKKRWQHDDLNNKGVLPMVAQYLMELAFVFGEVFRTCRQGAYIAFVNDNVRYGGEVIPIDTITTTFAESLGFEPLKIYVLAQKKGNSSQQMGKFGREELRKCITIWRKP